MSIKNKENQFNPNGKIFLKKNKEISESLRNAKKIQETRACKFRLRECAHGNANDLFLLWTHVLRHVKECGAHRAFHSTCKTNATSREDSGIPRRGERANGSVGEKHC